MNTPSPSARAYRRLGYLALGHAVILFGLTALVLQFEDSFWLRHLWVGLVTLWFLWLLVLALHKGRSLVHFIVWVSLSALVLFPSWRFYDLFAPQTLGLSPFVRMNPWSMWEFYRAYFAGSAEAKKDIAAGLLVIEEFGFGAGGGPHTQRILRERFQIEIRATAGCLVDDRILGHAAGYNKVSEAEIDRRVGLQRVAEAKEEGTKLAKEEHARQEQSFKKLTARLTSLPSDGKIITEFIRPYLDQQPLNDLPAGEELAPLIHAIERYLVAHVPKDAPPFTLHVSVYATSTSDPKFEISARNPPGPVYENIYNNLQTIAAPRWTRGSLTVSLDFVIR